MQDCLFKPFFVLLFSPRFLFKLSTNLLQEIHKFNQLSSTVAPADVLALSIKEASTAPEPAKEEENLERVDKVQNESPSENDAMVSGAEIESSGMELMSGLAVNVTATSVSLTWSAPDDAFDSFLVETVAVSAAAAQPQVNELPGSFRKAEIAGLLPSTMYEITLQGLMEGRQSVPLRVFTATGTPSKISLAAGIIPTPSSSFHCLLSHPG